MRCGSHMVEGDIFVLSMVCSFGNAEYIKYCCTSIYSPNFVYLLVQLLQIFEYIKGHCLKTIYSSCENRMYDFFLYSSQKFWWQHFGYYPYKIKVKYETAANLIMWHVKAAFMVGWELKIILIRSLMFTHNRIPFYLLYVQYVVTAMSEC